MGEAFRRKRARSFQHQQHAASRRLVQNTLLTLSRGRLACRELLARVSDHSMLPPVGSECLVRARVSGGHDVIHGNVVIANLGEEATELVSACTAEAPVLDGTLPCRVKSHEPFGGLSLVIDAPEDDSHE